jgi:hypothetical protein
MSDYGKAMARLTRARAAHKTALAQLDEAIFSKNKRRLRTAMKRLDRTANEYSDAYVDAEKRGMNRLPEFGIEGIRTDPR